MSIVSEHLEERGIEFEVLPHAQAFSAIDEARALGIHADEVVKTVVLDAGEGELVLAVVPAHRRLDLHRVEAALGRHARLATEAEIARYLPDFELGAIPPLRSLAGTTLLVDPEVMRHETVIFAAGSRTTSMKARVEHLFGHGGVEVVGIARHPEDEAAEKDPYPV